MRRPGFRIAIINPLTLVAKEIQAILNERGIPYSQMELVDTMGESAGALTEVNDEAAFVSEANDASFVGLDLAFFTGSATQNEGWLQRATDEGAIVIDLSTPAQAGDGVVVVAGVNENQLEQGVSVRSPHPISVPLILMLQQLLRETEVQLMAVSAIQPASEMGQAGVDELFKQTVGALNMQQIPKEVFDRQLAFNMYPANDASIVETTVTSQVHAIIGRQLPLSVSVTQGTTFHGHSYSIFLQLKDDLSVEKLREILGKGMSLDLSVDDDTYATIDAAGRDQILIGRVRKDPSVPRSYWLWAVSDNLRRAAALNAVMLAETMLAKFGEKPN